MGSCQHRWPGGSRQVLDLFSLYVLRATKAPSVELTKLTDVLEYRFPPTLAMTGILYKEDHFRKKSISKPSYPCGKLCHQLSMAANTTSAGCAMLDTVFTGVMGSLAWATEGNLRKANLSWQPRVRYMAQMAFSLCVDQEPESSARSRQGYSHSDPGPLISEPLPLAGSPFLNAPQPTESALKLGTNSSKTGACEKYFVCRL